MSPPSIQSNALGLFLTLFSFQLYMWFSLKLEFFWWPELTWRLCFLPCPCPLLSFRHSSPLAHQKATECFSFHPLTLYSIAYDCQYPAGRASDCLNITYKSLLLISREIRLLTGLQTTQSHLWCGQFIIQALTLAASVQNFTNQFASFSEISESFFVYWTCPVDPTYL